MIRRPAQGGWLLVMWHGLPAREPWAGCPCHVCGSRVPRLPAFACARPRARGPGRGEKCRFSTDAAAGGSAAGARNSLAFARASADIARNGRGRAMHPRSCLTIEEETGPRPGSPGAGVRVPLAQLRRLDRMTSTPGNVGHMPPCARSCGRHGQRAPANRVKRASCAAKNA